MYCNAKSFGFFKKGKKRSQEKNKNPEQNKKEPKRDPKDPKDRADFYEIFKEILNCPNALPHIFRNCPGHVHEMTEKNMFKFMNIIKSENLVEIDKFKEVYKKLLDSGEEIWVFVRNGKIFDAGINIIKK